MTDHTISSADVAKLLGVPLTTLNSARPYLVGFPRPVARGFYSRREVLRWKRGKDVKNLVSAAHQRRNREHYEQRDQRYQRFNAWVTRFIGGEFDPPAAQERAAFRRLAARTSPAKTETVHLVHDWMTE